MMMHELNGHSHCCPGLQAEVDLIQTLLGPVELELGLKFLGQYLLLPDMM